MSPTEFIHLHVHTVHSHLDSTITIESLIKQAIVFNMPAVAITDYATLDGADEFMRKCYEADIKPIVGSEMFVVDDITSSFSVKPSYHLLLLCKSRMGLQTLKSLVAYANKEGFRYKPCIDKLILKNHTDGLLALSACMRGEIPSLCLMGKYNEAVNVAREYAAMFPGDFYIELQENSLPEQKIVNQSLLKIAAELNLPIVATNDCHYLTPEDAIEHEKLMCEQTGKSMSDPTHMRYSADEFYFKAPQEMISAFSYAPEAINNTSVIANKCHVVTTSSTHHEDGTVIKTDYETMVRDKEYNEKYHARWDRIYKAQAEGVSAVGIFWLFPGMRLEYFDLPYTEAFDDGEYITVRHEHAARWNSFKRNIQKLNGELKEFTYEYNHFPRGRVEYCKPLNTFIIYGPGILINDEKSLELVKSTFHLENQLTEAVVLAEFEDYADV